MDTADREIVVIREPTLAIKYPYGGHEEMF